MRMQTHTDAVESLLSQSVILPPELLVQIEIFLQENKHLGYTTREELIRDAVRWRLRFLKEEYECVEVPKEEYDKLQTAIKDMGLPFLNVNDFIDQQIKNVVAKHAELTKQKQEYDRKRRTR